MSISAKIKRVDSQAEISAGRTEKMALTFDRDQNDTIAAIATGMSEAGIGIVRISGTQAEDIIRRIYCTKSMCEICL